VFSDFFRTNSAFQKSDCIFANVIATRSEAALIK